MASELDVGSIFHNRKQRPSLGPAAAVEQPKPPETPEEMRQVELQQAAEVAASLGFRPTDFEDLPEDESEEQAKPAAPVAAPEQPQQFNIVQPEPVYGKPTVMRSPDGKPNGVKAPPVVNNNSRKQTPLPQLPVAAGMSEEETRKLSKEFDAAFGKNRKEAITNKIEEVAVARYTSERIGKSFTHEDADDPPENFKNGTRLDNVSGLLPYRKTTHRGRIYITELTAAEIGAFAKAVRQKSYSLLFDCLGKHVNVSYRRLTVADHRQIMYYHLIESYPPTKIEGISWTSRLYGVNNDNSTGLEFHIVEKSFDMSEDEWDKYEAMGFTLPRVYDTEQFQSLADLEKEEDYTALILAQYLDPEHPLIAPFVRAAHENNSTAARLQGRLDYMATKPMKWTAELAAFRERVKEFGISEYVTLTADVKGMTVAQAIGFLESIEEPLSEAQSRELARLKSLLPPQDELDKFVLRHDELSSKENRSEEENAELEAMNKNNPWDKKFTPVPEKIPFNRDPWRFFPFLQTVNAA